jgi:3-isopropylmalate/(R)-2-methylmalate dehydratase small subunit
VLGERVTVDLIAQEVRSGDVIAPFAIDAEAKAMLAEGLDGIDLTFKHRAVIKAFLGSDRIARPWIYLEQVA